MAYAVISPDILLIRFYYYLLVMVS